MLASGGWIPDAGHLDCFNQRAHPKECLMAENRNPNQNPAQNPGQGQNRPAGQQGQNPNPRPDAGRQQQNPRGSEQEGNQARNPADANRPINPDRSANKPL